MMAMTTVTTQTEGRHQYQLHMCFHDFPSEIGRIFEEIGWFSNLCTDDSMSLAFSTSTASHRLLLVVLPFPGHTFAAPEVPATRATWNCQVGTVKVFPTWSVNPCQISSKESFPNRLCALWQLPSLKLTVHPWKLAESQKERIVSQLPFFRGYC